MSSGLRRRFQSDIDAFLDEAMSWSSTRLPDGTATDIDAVLREADAWVLSKSEPISKPVVDETYPTVAPPLTPRFRPISPGLPPPSEELPAPVLEAPPVVLPGLLSVVKPPPGPEELKKERAWTEALADGVRPGERAEWEKLYERNIARKEAERFQQEKAEAFFTNIHSPEYGQEHLGRAFKHAFGRDITDEESAKIWGLRADAWRLAHEGDSQRQRKIISEISEEDLPLFGYVYQGYIKANPRWADTGPASRLLSVAAQATAAPPVGAMDTIRQLTGARVPLSKEQEQAFVGAKLAREGLDPLIRPDLPTTEKVVLRAVEFAIPQLEAAIFSKGLGTAAKGAASILGKGAKAAKIAGAAERASQYAGFAGTFYPMIQQDHRDSLIAEGVDPDVADRASHGAALIELLIEGIEFAPFKGVFHAFKGDLFRRAWYYGKDWLTKAAKEWGEEGLQTVCTEWFKNLARASKDKPEWKSLGPIFDEGKETLQQTFAPIMLSMGVAAGKHVGSAEYTRRRLLNLEKEMEDAVKIKDSGAPYGHVQPPGGPGLGGETRAQVPPAGGGAGIREGGPSERPGRVVEGVEAPRTVRPEKVTPEQEAQTFWEGATGNARRQWLGEDLPNIVRMSWADLSAQQKATVTKALGISTAAPIESPVLAEVIQRREAARREAEESQAVVDIIAAEAAKDPSNSKIASLLHLATQRASRAAGALDTVNDEIRTLEGRSRVSAPPATQEAQTPSTPSATPVTQEAEPASARPVVPESSVEAPIAPSAPPVVQETAQKAPEAQAAPTQAPTPWYKDGGPMAAKVQQTRERLRRGLIAPKYAASVLEGFRNLGEAKAFQASLGSQQEAFTLPDGREVTAQHLQEAIALAEADPAFAERVFKVSGAVGAMPPDMRPVVSAEGVQAPVIVPGPATITPITVAQTLADAGLAGPPPTPVRTAGLAGVTPEPPILYGEPVAPEVPPTPPVPPVVPGAVPPAASEVAPAVAPEVAPPAAPEVASETLYAPGGMPEGFEAKPGRVPVYAAWAPAGVEPASVEWFEAMPTPAPQLVELAKAILGEFPLVSERLRALGAFKTKTGQIFLNAILGKNPTLCAKVMAHELGHAVDWLPEAMTQRGNILGRIASLQNYLKGWLEAYPGGPPPLTDKERARLRQQAKKLLSVGARIWVEEEIVTVFQVEPADILAIWNSFDQTGLNPDLLRYIKQLSTEEKMDIVKEALRGKVGDDLQRFARTVREKTGRKVEKIVEEKPTAEDIAKKYRELLRKEVEARMLLSNEVIRDELKRLSRWWSPYDPKAVSSAEVARRESSTELYADALGVFFMSPGDLFQRAPEFTRGFIAWMGEKPKFKEEWQELQGILYQSPEALAAHNSAILRAMHMRGDEKVLTLLEANHDAELDSVARTTQMMLGRAFLAQAYPVYKATKKVLESGKATKEQAAAATAAMYALEELRYRQSKVRQFLDRINVEVLRPLIQGGISRGDVGVFLTLRRIMNDRGEILNPYLFNPKIAATQIEYEKKIMGEKKWDILEKSMKRFHDLVYPLTEQAVKYGVYSAKAHKEHVEPNKDNYATFMVIRHLEGNISPMLKQQVGTVEEIMNPLDSTIMKMVSLIRLIEFNRVKEKLRDFMLLSFPRESNKIPIPHGSREPVVAPRTGFKHMLMLEDGRMAAYEMPVEIAESVMGQDLGVLQKIASLIGHPTYKVFHTLFVTQNPGFLCANPFRDMFRTWVNLGAIGSKKSRELKEKLMALGHSPEKAAELADPAKITIGDVCYFFLRNIPTGVRRAAGISDKTIDEMFNHYALATPYVELVRHTFPRSGKWFKSVISRLKRKPKKGETAEKAAKEVAGKMEPITWGEGAVERLIVQNDMAIEKERVQGWGQLWHFVKGFFPFIGQVEETAMKAGAWQLLQEKAEYARGLGVELFHPQEPASIVRQYAGTPNWKEGGHLTPVLNAVRMYGNVLLQDMWASYKLGFSKGTAAGWWWRHLVKSIVPTTLIKLATYGYAGPIVYALMRGIGKDKEEAQAEAEEFTEMVKRVSSYYTNTYITLPLGSIIDPSGRGERLKTLVLTVPQDMMGQTLSRFWAHVMDCGAELAGVETKAGSAWRAGVEAIGSLAGDFIPDEAPPLQIFNTWRSFLMGNNPTDPHYGSPIIPPETWQAHDANSWKTMLAWTESKTGIFGQMTSLVTGPLLGKPYSPDKMTTLEVLLKIPLGFQRFFRMDKRGQDEEEFIRLEMEEEISSRRHLTYSHETQSLVRMRGRLMRRLPSSLTPTERFAKEATDFWYANYYSPVDEIIEHTADKEKRKEYREKLNTATLRYWDKIEANMGPDPWMNPNLSPDKVKLCTDALVEALKVVTIHSGRPQKPGKESSEIDREEYVVLLEEWEKERADAEAWLEGHRASPYFKDAQEKTLRGLAHARGAFEKGTGELVNKWLRNPKNLSE